MHTHSVRPGWTTVTGSAVENMHTDRIRNTALHLRRFGQRLEHPPVTMRFPVIPILMLGRGNRVTCRICDNEIISGIAEKRFIELGPETGNKTVVERGLLPGEQIVVEGYHKLAHGQKARTADVPAVAAN